MAGESDVTIRGLAELAAGARRLAANIDDAAGREFGRVAGDTASQVSGTVPRRTGQLAGSVIAEARPDGASISMGEGVPYARYVEFGGRGHPRSVQGNYLYPAVVDAGPQLQAAGEQAAQSEIGRMAWPSP